MSVLHRMTVCITLLALLAWAAPSLAGAPLETETARFASPGVLEVEGAFEAQQSKDGRESALPLAFEYTLTHRLALMAEPVPFTRIRPKGAVGATGAGDIEVTLSGLLLAETPGHPALALAGEVKIPTGSAPVIGSGESDYTGYLIASKQFHRLDTHANVGYTRVGRPAALEVNNTFSYALAGEYAVAPSWTMVAEVLGNTAALPEASSTTESTVAPEISGGEVTGMLGARWKWAPNATVSLGMTVDNAGAVLFRPGLGFRF